MIILDGWTLTSMFGLLACYFWANDPERKQRQWDSLKRDLGMLPPEPPTRMQRLGYWLAREIGGNE